MSEIVPVGRTVKVADFLHYQPGSIHGYKFEDLNVNRVDNGEPRIAGVTITLIGGVAGDVGSATTTELDGSYIFSNLPSGAYVVVATPPGGFTQTGDPDEFGLPATNPDDRTTTPVLLSPNEVFLNVDFGYQPDGRLGVIGDQVWLDCDTDGNYEPLVGEYGIPGVTVALALDANNNGRADRGEIIGSQTTDVDGKCLFTGLRAGNYLVWVNDTDDVLTGTEQTSALRRFRNRPAWATSFGTI